VPHALPDLVELMSERPTSIGYEIAEPLARFLRTARDTAGGDLDKALVMVEIILRASQHPSYRGLTPDDLEAEDEAVFPSLGTNVRSIADSTGISKETVRRKVLELIEAGWVVRQGRSLYYSVDGYRAISPAREAMLRMYARAYLTVESLLDGAGPDGGLRDGAAPLSRSRSSSASAAAARTR
jgi:hypothetical protein